MFVRTIILILTTLVLFACEKKSDWDIQPADLSRIVVDATLTSEFKHQVIRLSRPVSGPNEESLPASGAIVFVKTDTTTWIFTETQDEPGIYFSQDLQGASIDKTYHLEIQYQGGVYTASTYMVPVIPSWPIEIVPSGNNDALKKLNWTASAYNPDDLAMYEADISWSHLVNDPDSLTTIRLLHYALNTVDVSYVIFPQDKEEVFFPAGSILIIKKYSLTEEHDAYLRALLAETEWQGSLFEDARGNLPTNISNNGLGYFGACSVVADTVVVGD